MAEAMQPTRAGDAAAALPPLPPAELAPHFPQLEILELLGRGGMGVVYRARQKSLNRLVALKLLAPDRADDPAFAARFEKEAQALAALNHPNIVAVYDFGRAGGFYYLLMEYVDGVNLRQLLRARRLSPREALAIVPPICDALQCAHDHGIVHRDIKPENLLMHRSGAVKIADFGIARIVGESGAAVAPCAGSTGEPPVVHSAAAGTPDYAAPEQRAENREVDHRADIYSLGVVLYEMLTGERPAEKIEPPSKRVQVDVRIDEVVLRALEPQPERRYQTAAEMRTQVETIARHSAPAWEPPNSGWGWLVGKMFGVTFRSRFAFRLANLSALGFLGFLGFVPLPGWHRLFGLSGFFGLIGVAFLIELGARGSRAVKILAVALLAFGIAFPVGSWVAYMQLGVRTPMRAGGSKPEIESVEVTREQAIVNARGRNDAGMIFLFGTGPNRWSPKSLYLGGMFDVTLRGRPLGSGVRWTIKPRSGTRWSYHLDTPGGDTLGTVVFREGRPAPEADGSYVIAEFRPESGEPLPIAVRLERDKPAGDVAAKTQQAWQLWQSGRPAEALQIFREAVKRTPEDANLWNGLGWAAFNSGHFDEALAAFQRVLQFDPQHMAAHNGVGQICFARHDYAGAEAAFLQAAPQGASAAWYGLAKLYLLQEKFPEAEKYAQMLEDSGQADALAKKMLEAAKARRLPEGLRAAIEPQ
jgi:predicted Ser/Thr protein kinase